MFRRSLLASAVGASLLLTGCGSGARSAVDAAATPTVAPSAVKSGPQLGYIWSTQAQTLRPVLGVPGSSQLGQSVIPANLYVAASASAVTDLALLQETDGALDLMALPTGTPARLSVTLTPGAQMRFAPSGNAAIAFAPGAGSVTLLTNLSTTPQATAVTFNAAISDAAVSDAGSVAAALSQGTGFAVKTVSSSGATNPAATVGTLGGLNFVGASDDLLVADAAANSVTLVRNSASAPSATLLPSASLLNGPLGVAASHDGHWAVLANSGDAGIIRLDLTAKTAPQRFTCACQPALIAQLSGPGVFRVTAADKGPAWMIDAAASTPRVLFIPALAEDPAASSSKTGQN